MNKGQKSDNEFISFCGKCNLINFNVQENQRKISLVTNSNHADNWFLLYRS